MSRLSDRAGEVRSGGAGRTWAIILLLVLLAIIYPSIVESLQDLPADRGLHPAHGLDGRDDRLHDDGGRA